MPKRRIADIVEMEQLLKTAQIGSMATVGADGEAYITPLNFVYIEGSIYFHAALSGRKLENIAAHPMVCFNAWEMQRLVLGENAGDCSVRYTSVICYGLASIVPNGERKLEILTELSAKYMDTRPEPPTEAYARKCALVEIRVEEMSGKKNVDE